MIQEIHPLLQKDVVDQITPIERLLIEYELYNVGSVAFLLEHLMINGKKKIHEIIEETGLSQQMVRYARIKLMENGLIHTKLDLRDMRGSYYLLTDVARQLLGIDDNV